MNGLATGSAGLAGGVVEVNDGDGADANFWAVKADGGGDSGLLRAYGEPVGGVFHVAAGDDSTVGEQDGGADAEVAIGGIGVVGDGYRPLLQICSLRGCELSGRIVTRKVVVRRHDVSEAIGCGER